MCQVDNGYTSQYSNMLNIYIKVRLYTRTKAQQCWQKQGCEVGDNEDARVMMWRGIALCVRVAGSELVSLSVITPKAKFPLFRTGCPSLHSPHPPFILRPDRSSLPVPAMFHDSPCHTMKTMVGTSMYDPQGCHFPRKSCGHHVMIAQPCTTHATSLANP